MKKYKIIMVILLITLLIIFIALKIKGYDSNNQQTPVTTEPVQAETNPEPTVTTEPTVVTEPTVTPEPTIEPEPVITTIDGNNINTDKYSSDEIENIHSEVIRILSEKGYKTDSVTPSDYDIADNKVYLSIDNDLVIVDLENDSISIIESSIPEEQDEPIMDNE